MTKIRAEGRWRMPSESYSLEKLHPVSNTFKYYFMLSTLVRDSVGLFDTSVERVVASLKDYRP